MELIELVFTSDNLTPEKLRNIFMPNTDEEIINLFQKMIRHLSLDDLKKLDFGKFSIKVKQSFLSLMLWNRISTEMVCVLLDEMKSINYGKYSKIPPSEISRVSKINPLFFCCYFGNFDLVKLLVERYHADIEHLNKNGCTAIMYSACEGDEMITKYLYDRGARLQTLNYNINDFATNPIKNLIVKWELERKSTKTDTELDCNSIKTDNHNRKQDIQETETKMNELAQIKADYLKLQQENDCMKRNYQNILNLLQNGPK